MATSEMLPVEKSAFHYERARKLLREGLRSSIELERVIKEVGRAIAFHKYQVKHFLLLGEIFKQSLDLTSAIYALRYALRLKPEYVRAKKKLYELLCLSGVELMSQAQSDTGENVSSSLFRRANDRFEEAMQIELTLDKPNPDLWVYRAICDLNLGKLNDAFKYIDTCIKIRLSSSGFPNPGVELYILKAKIYWAQGMMDLGNKEMLYAATMTTKHPEVIEFASRTYLRTERLYKAGVMLFAKERLEDAIKCIKSALIVTKHDVKLHVILCKMYRKKGDLDEAYASIQEAIKVFKLNSIPPGARQATAKASLKVPLNMVEEMHLIFNDMAINSAMKGEYMKALALLNQIITDGKKLNIEDGVPIDYRFYINRGDCYRGIGEISKSIVDYETALAAAPHDRKWDIQTRLSLVHYTIAIEHFNSGAYRDSEKELSICIDLNPKVSEYYAVRGKTRYYQSAYKEAYQDFKIANSLAPENQEVVGMLAQFESVESSKLKNASPNSALSDVNDKPLESHQLLVPTPTDTIKALLNYKMAKGLPTVTRHKISKILSENSKVPSIVRSNYKEREVKLPHIDLNTTTSGSATALRYSILGKEKAQMNLSSILNVREGTGRSSYWAILDGAKNLVKMDKVEKTAPAAVTLTAAEMSMKQKREGLNIQNATTADALKRLSKEKTRLALNDPNACVAGIVASATDPFVVALEQTITLSSKNSIKKIQKKMKISSRSLKSGEKLLFASSTIGCRVAEPFYGLKGQRNRVDSYESSSVIESVKSYQSSQSSETTHKSSVKVGTIDDDEEDFSLLDFTRNRSDIVDDADDVSTLGTITKDEKMDSDCEDEEDTDTFLVAQRPKSFLFDL